MGSQQARTTTQPASTTVTLDRWVGTVSQILQPLLGQSPYEMYIDGSVARGTVDQFSGIDFGVVLNTYCGKKI